MGCTSSSLKGEFNQAEDLARPVKVSARASSAQVNDSAREPFEHTMEDEATGPPSSELFSSQPKRPPLSEEELTGGTDRMSERLQVLSDDKERYAAAKKRNAASYSKADAVNTYSMMMATGVMS